MSYATEDQIKSEFKSITFSATSKVTSAEVTRFLEEADATIDSYVGTIYTVPVTAERALVVLRGIEIDIVSTRVAKILRIKTAMKGDIKQEILDGSSMKFAMARLKDIQAGRATLLDADLISSGAGVNSFIEDDNTNDYSPEFDVEKVQW